MILYEQVILPHTSIDRWLVNNIMWSCESVLEMMGFELLPRNSIYHNHIGIDGSSGVVIGNPCDGIELFLLYASFLILFSGKIWGKFLFICFGIICIHLLNIARIIALAIIALKSPESLDFHHSYTFTIIVYLLVFLIWKTRISFYRKFNI